MASLPADTAAPPELAALKRSAAQGDADSQFELGILYEYGQGMPGHLANAYCWYARAAAQGDTRAAQHRDALRSRLTRAEIARCEPTARIAQADTGTFPGAVTDFSTPIRLAQDPQLPPEGSLVATLPVEVYRDALIDPNATEDAADLAGTMSGASTLLPGNASAEYRYFDQKSTGTSSAGYIEHGLAVEARQETRNHGRFEARGIFTDASADGYLTNVFSGGGYGNLTQRGFALTDRWQMTNELGHLRARVPEMLAQGYRVRLPEPLIQGAFSESRSSDTTLRLGGGTLGTLQGRTFPVFSTDYSSGSVAGLSATTRLGPQWQGSAQIWQANEALTAQGVRSYTSAGGAIQYNAREAGKGQVNLLGNSGGALGLWADGEKRLGGWLQNAGVYRMDPNLEWIDRNSSILTDTQGVYWRGTTRSFRTTYSLGADWSQSNVDDNPASATRDSTYGFGNIAYQYSSSLNLSGFLSLGQDSARGPSVDTRDTTTTARGTASNRFVSGTSTWTLGVVDRSGSTPSTRYDGNWDHYWNPFAGLSSLRGGIAYVQQSGSTNDYGETQLRGGTGWNRDGLSLGLNGYVGYLTGDTIDSSRTANATLAFGWQFLRGWRLGADFTYNQNSLHTVGLAEARFSDRQVMVSLRYDASWGRAESPLGLTNGKFGRGAVSGILYYDKNGNGVRDADEGGVPNVTVYLDRGAAVETNMKGEFSFNPVASGDHQLSVNIANIPLPWVIDEQRPITATVRPRETAVVEIPLIRIGPN